MQSATIERSFIELLAARDAGLVQTAIHAVGRGEIVVVSDDFDRENEADLILSAASCTAEQMAFVIRHGCGIVCAPVSGSIASALDLYPMVAKNSSSYATNFTVSIDLKSGLHTGIAASERAATCRALADPNSAGGDFARPGHVFPLIAVDDGVLRRPGHTEAAVDLCRLAGLPSAAVICELFNDDGTVLRGEQVIRFAAEHDLVRLTIADLRKYRLLTEDLVQPAGKNVCNSPAGELVSYRYSSRFDAATVSALVMGDVARAADVPVAFHVYDAASDIFGGSAAAAAAIARFAETGCGVLFSFPQMMRASSSSPISGIPGTDWDAAVAYGILKDLKVGSVRHPLSGRELIIA